MGNEKKTGINDDIKKLSTLVKENYEKEENGTLKFDPKTYDKTLEGAGLSIEDVKKYQKHNSDFVAAASLAVGEIGTDVMKQNASINTVSSRFKLGHDKLDVTFDRHQEIPNKEGGVDTIHGVSNAGYTTFAAGSKKQLGEVRDYLKEEAKKVLSK